METLIDIAGFVLIWIATDIGRKQESKVKIFTINWWLMFFLIATGVYIIN